MDIKKYSIIVLMTILILGLVFFSGYRVAYNSYANKNLRDTTVITKYDTTYIAGEVISATDTLYKNKTVRDSVFIPNPLDSALYADYCVIRDSLNKLNITQDLKFDTLTSNNNRIDSLSITCNTIKQTISFKLRYGLDKEIVKTKETTIYINDFQWDTFTYGGITGAVACYLLSLIGK